MALSSELAVRKAQGAFYTPEAVARSLVAWVVRDAADAMLDPACGDGRFLRHHARSVGVEQDEVAADEAQAQAASATIHRADFFAWAEESRERYDCVAGNPPFIRYQRFTGDVRDRALRMCRALGAPLSALTSSWAPFVAVAAAQLKPGGRMAFVVPAEIGHAPYAGPLLDYLLDNFTHVQVVAVRERLFVDLSEDCWLLYAAGYGGRTEQVALSVVDAFDYCTQPPPSTEVISRGTWYRWRRRLRPFLLPDDVRRWYQQMQEAPGAVRLGQVAKVGIGYVSGDNDFFHLRPSEAEHLGFTPDYLATTVRSGRLLAAGTITQQTVDGWMRSDQPCLLMRIRKGQALSSAVRKYLDSDGGRRARQAYKCRTRDPWYVVPDVRVPDAFLAYMNGGTPALVANQAGCVCANSVHAVVLNGQLSLQQLCQRWQHPAVALSCEVEGHPLGGGMLKVEPGEAAEVLLPALGRPVELDARLAETGLRVMRGWRHCG